MEDTKTCLEKQPLSQEMLEKMNAYWRAANYLSAGQLYLLDNPLLKEPLTMDQIKKKIVGHWGTVPGQNFIYVHCNREIKRYDLDMILLSGPKIRKFLFSSFNSKMSRMYPPSSIISCAFVLPGSTSIP